MKFYAVFSNGRELDIDDGTYKELTRRIDNGKVKGWYKIKQGPSMGCTVNIESLSSVEMVMTDAERKAAEEKNKKDLEERLAKLENKAVSSNRRAEGSFSYEPDTCPINHAKAGKKGEPNIEIRYYTTDQDIKHYAPFCTMCGWVGPIVKPAAIKNTFGIKAEDVQPLYKED